MRIAFKLIFLLALLGLALAYCVVRYQEHLLFPYFSQSAKLTQSDREEPLPPGVERVLLGADQNKIEVWVKQPASPPRGTAIIFRANTGSLDEHHALYEWTSQHGFVSGIFNYPGMGLSDGSPTEESILSSGRRVFEYLKSRTPPEAQRTWVLGYSIGTGAAAIFSSELKPDLLTLFAPYTDLKDVVYSHRVFRIFTPFLRLHFNTKQAIESLRKTDFIVATGGADTTVLPSISHEVFDYYHGEGKSKALHNPRGPHDKLLATNLPALEETLKQFGYQ